MNLKISNKESKIWKNWLKESKLKRYFINKLKKINQELSKQYVEPVKILCVHESNNKIDASLVYSDGRPYEKYYFDSNDELENFMQENNVANVIRNICFDSI